jgi:D-alanyl-D-alanine dipeptidase
MAGWPMMAAQARRPALLPKLQKGSLFALGYISSRSQHSTGVAVDLTLIAAGARMLRPSNRGPYGPCTGPAPQRSPDNSVDMGTGFDCFDAKSHTASGDIASDQRQSRRKLVAAMAAHGFHNYHREWWHFSYGRLGIAAGGYDFAIRPRTTVNPAGGHADGRPARR